MGQFARRIGDDTNNGSALGSAHPWVVNGEGRPLSASHPTDFVTARRPDTGGILISPDVSYRLLDRSARWMWPDEYLLADSGSLGVVWNAKLGCWSIGSGWLLHTLVTQFPVEGGLC